MSLKKLQEKAKALGMTDFDGLDEAALTAEIAKVESHNELVMKAESLGIENANDLSSEELTSLILANENAVLNAQVDAFTTTLGLESGLTPEEIETAVKEKLASVSGIEVEVDKEPKGKTDETYKAKNGKVYGFTEKAPHAFRFAGVVKTQKDWIEDKDSMEIMIDGNLSYLETKKTK